MSTMVPPRVMAVVIPMVTVTIDVPVMRVMVMVMTESAVMPV